MSCEGCMIPLKLQIKNFLSYGSEIQTINFEPYHLICLSGKNGHGKSALLDAITWGIWGQARKVSGVAKADDGLLRLGQQQMMVILDFLCNGQQYQVRREYCKSNYGKTYVNLDFGIFDESKNGFVPVAGKGVRATQMTIEEVVRLDFDSFCNSVCLRQGQSNEFSKKSPKDRKEVLGAILGLGQYEVVRKLASDKAREAQTERIALQAVLERAQQELQHLTNLKEALQKIAERRQLLMQDEVCITMQQQKLQQQKLSLAEECKQYQFAALQLEELKKTEKEKQVAIRERLLRWRKINAQHRAFCKQGDVESRHRQLLDELDRQQEHMHKGLGLKEQLLEQKRLLHEREQLLLQEGTLVEHAQHVVIDRTMIEQQVLQEKLNTLKQTQEDLLQEKSKLQTGLQEAVDQREKASLQCQVIDKVRQQFEKRKSFYQQMVTQETMLKRERDALAHKMSLSQDDANPSCPLCEQNLSTARRHFLRQKFLKDEDFLNHRLGRITQIIKRLKTLLIQQQKQLAVIEQSAELQKSMSMRIDDYTMRLKKVRNELEAIQEQQKNGVKEHDQRAAHLKVQEEKLQELQRARSNRLEVDDQYAIIKKQIDIIEKELSGHKNDMCVQQEIRLQLQQLDQQMKSYQEWLTQCSQQEQRKEEIAALCVQLKNIKAEKENFVQIQKKLEKISYKQKLIVEHEKALEKEWQELVAAKESLLQEQGSLESQRKKLAEVEDEYHSHQNKLHAVEEKIDDFQAIAAATGKDGIQALLIQDVLPEMEQEANHLLAKLTDNQAQVFIESLRDLKKGGTKETLDINISDGLGIRPYEMFSGGEAFRIDFALRIAISKLLARRAGASLQTLIIDEGFGSQDEDGLSCIMDVLYRIQDDFAKIIIVSHLPSMKDQFPVHFYVEKRASGSMVNIVEQG